MAALDSGLMEQAHERKKDPCFWEGNFVSSLSQLVRNTVLFALKTHLLWRYNCLLGRKWEHEKYFSTGFDKSFLVGRCFLQYKLTTTILKQIPPTGILQYLMCRSTEYGDRRNIQLMNFTLEYDIVKEEQQSFTLLWVTTARTNSFKALRDPLWLRIHVLRGGWKCHIRCIYALSQLLLFG